MIFNILLADSDSVRRGSNPRPPATRLPYDPPLLRREHSGPGGRTGSRFELPDCRQSKLWTAVQVVGIEDRADVPERVPGERRDLRFRASRERQAAHRRAPQVVVREAGDAGGAARLAPGRAEAVAGPGPVLRAQQDHGAGTRRRVENRLQRAADRDHHPGASLRLLEADHRAVVGRPGQPQQVAVPLPGPEGQNPRQVEVRRRRPEEARLVIVRPHLVGALGPVEAYFCKRLNRSILP